MAYLRDNGIVYATMIHGKGHARYFRVVKCKDSDPRTSQALMIVMTHAENATSVGKD
jgi:hypothetical protein